MSTPSRGIQLAFFFIAFGLLLVVAFLIFKPYINTLVLAATFAIIAYPLYKRIDRFFKNKIPSISSLITVILVGVIVLVPLTYLGVQVFDQSTSLYANLTDPNRSEINPLGDVTVSSSPYIQKIQEKVAGSISLNFEVYVQKALSWILDNAGGLFGQIATFALMFFIWLLGFYYFLRDGKRVANWFVDFSPLSDIYDREIVLRIATAVRSTIGGSLIVALLQGILAGVGFAIFGVPAFAIWGMLAVIAALVPTVGTGLITIPAAAYLFLIGNVNGAIGMALWGIVVVGLVDNLLRPKLIERGIHVHSLVILLAVLGGIALFGPVGFIIGPIVVTLVVEFGRIYQEMIVDGKNKKLANG
ncbi:MAG: hypothetical protein COU10_03785 [Candidatus Harrisonbacteria bacterium CG10_big_fil_rev_8_21_14_0_10_45_28]|uniref:AI-2E family transporter n=1 Tax=Candidatus Harrisonbacteria bacterium CG10_big_fil_rev_8_21_14_0_10_45_28 TaxID=1974586 RepID=A0A2H0UMF0_9BACT|nr:MAG: hypothetical protein COU10_03785 [Candidatus Harrisonbacteria bacterium CG10_big_fil_rev_8_21_14_0_10_45_28]